MVSNTRVAEDRRRRAGVARDGGVHVRDRPSRRAQLRIPDFGALHDVSDLRVIVVPLGTARKRDGTPDLASAVVSELEPAQYLVSMLWSLTGRTLTSAAEAASLGDQGAAGPTPGK